MAPDPRVREIGRVEDINGGAVVTGVDYDAVTIAVSLHPATLTRAQASELMHQLADAMFEAGDCAGRMAAEL